MYCRREKSVVPTLMALFSEEFDRNGVKFRVEIPDFPVLQCTACSEQVFTDESCIRLWTAVNAAAKEAGA